MVNKRTEMSRMELKPAMLLKNCLVSTIQQDILYSSEFKVIMSVINPNPNARSLEAAEALLPYVPGDS